MRVEVTPSEYLKIFQKLEEDSELHIVDNTFAIHDILQLFCEMDRIEVTDSYNVIVILPLYRYYDNNVYTVVYTSEPDADASHIFIIKYSDLLNIIKPYLQK